MIKHLLITVTASVALCLIAQAQEKFQIPKVQEKQIVGEWKVVKMGEGDKLEPVPEGRFMGMTFRADGSGIHKKGERERVIVWGADDKGAFAAQWKQENGKGDGIMGTWKMTDEGLLMQLQEWEDGQEPEDKFTLLMQRAEG